MELPPNLLLYLLLLIAVAAGYLLGRRERKSPRSDEDTVKEYYQGLNVLLEERSELSVERFVRSAEVSEQTLDVHLAMAAVVRRRGELDKGIAIHQNLLASPMLSVGSKQLVELELARDYHAAGLLDRAEQLLHKIVREKTPQRQAAVELLLNLYEQERDWDNALLISRQIKSPDPAALTRIAHFHFEKAQTALDADLPHEALPAVRKGLSLQPEEVRGYWLRAQLELVRRNFKSARRYLQKAYEHQPDLAAVLLAPYKEVCDALEDEAGYEQFLRQCLQDQPNPAVLVALQQHLRLSGRSLPADELLSQMQAQPQLGHVPILMELMTKIQQSPPASELELSELQAQIEQLTQQILKTLDESTYFKCASCGFKSRKVVWQCPTCKTWGSFGLAA